MPALLKRLVHLVKSADELLLLGCITAILWICVSVTWSQRSGQSQLLWLCDIATLGTALGLLLRNRLLLTAQFVGMLLYHLCWHFDFFSYVITDTLPFSATSYMFNDALTPYEKSLSFFQHTFIIPITVWALLRLGASTHGWLFQTCQTGAAFLLTFVLTDPTENINWIFGAGLADLSPARINPVLYYLLMALVPPVLIYKPTNLLATWLVSRADQAAYGVPAVGRMWLVIAFTATTAVAAFVVGRACEVDTSFPEKILALPPEGETPLEQVPVDARAPRILSVSYGLPSQRQALPMLIFDKALPRFGEANGYLGTIATKHTLETVRLEAIPGSPQQVVVRGERGRKGAVIHAIVASDQFYLQAYYDANTALDDFEVYCQLGREGLSEFVDPVSGRPWELVDDRYVVGGGVGVIYALMVVAVDEGAVVARSPVYLFKRTGVYVPDDIVWSEVGGQRVPHLRSASSTNGAR